MPYKFVEEKPKFRFVEEEKSGLTAWMEVPRAIGQNLLASGAKGLSEVLMGSPESRKAQGLPPDTISSAIGQALSFTPTSKGAQTALDVIGYPGKKFAEGAEFLGRTAGEASGSPMLGEMVEKGVKIAPYGVARVGSPQVGAARTAGFRLSPVEKGVGGPISGTAASLSGEARLNRMISLKNQELVNQKIAADFGLPKGVPVTTEALQTIRKQAGKAYKAVEKTGTVAADQQYLADLIQIRDKFAPAAMDFPGAANKSILKDLRGIAQEKFGSEAAVGMVNQLRDKASTAYRTGSNAEGGAYKAMASAMEAQIERHLVATGQPAELVKAMRDARSTIARTYTAEEALNAGSGQINAAVFGKRAATGKPLTGGAKEVGEAAAAFPRSLQKPGLYQGTGPAFGDIALGVGSALTGQNPSLGQFLYGVLPRPMLRSLLASKGGQALAGRPLLGPVVTPGLLGVGEEERFSPY